MWRDINLGKIKFTYIILANFTFKYEAKKWQLPRFRPVLIFSNLAEITNATETHPIEKELAEGGRFQLEKCLKRAVKKTSDKTKRDQHWRSSEEVELWVLINN